MLARLAAATITAASLAASARAQDRRSTYEPETLLNAPAGTTNFRHASISARDCMHECIRDRRCGFWLYIIEYTCLLYPGAPASRHLGRRDHVSGQIIRR
jgi:hypothetical protein